MIRYVIGFKFSRRLFLNIVFKFLNVNKTRFFFSNLHQLHHWFANKVSIFLLAILILSSCKRQSNSFFLTENQRLDSLLIDPIEINSDLRYFKIENIKFYKSYILSENRHHKRIEDSIIRFASTQNDVIEVFKNEYIDKVVLIRFSSDNLKLKYNIHVGMTYDKFTSLMPYKEPFFNSVIYQNEYSTLEFAFDKNFKNLKRIKCIYYLD